MTMGLLDSAKKLGKKVGKYKDKFNEWDAEQNKKYIANLNKEEQRLSERINVRRKEEKIAKMRRRLAPKPRKKRKDDYGWGF